MAKRRRRNQAEPEGEPRGETIPEPEGEPRGETIPEPEGEPRGETIPEPEGEREGETIPEPEGEPRGETMAEPEGEPREGETMAEPEGEPREGETMAEGEGAPGDELAEISAVVRAAGEESGVSVPREISLLPVMEPEFNLREIAKQMLLLESHLAVPRQRCADCIRKHYATIEALAEEGASLDAGRGKLEALFHEIAEFARLWQARLYPQGISGAASSPNASSAPLGASPQASSAPLGAPSTSLLDPETMRLAAAALRKARKPILKIAGIAFFDGKRYALAHRLARAIAEA